MIRSTSSDVAPKPVRWVGTSKQDLSAFPEDVKRRVGRALWDAQIGLKAPFAKPLKEVEARDLDAQVGAQLDRAADIEGERGLRIMAKHSRITATPGSGNVFADLGFAEPEEELAKAQLATLIGQVIKRRRLTQAAAAALMGVDQPKVSALLNGRVANFSSERLMRLLTALGRDIDIIVRRSSGRRIEGRIRVIEEVGA